MMIYTTKTGSVLLGIARDTLKRYANRYGLGSQPGGFHTPHVFTLDDLLAIRLVRRKKEYATEAREDMEALGLPPYHTKFINYRKHTA